jgi:hypothetical protein
MINFERAIIFAFALLKVFLLLVADFPGLTMARVAEVMRAEAEEECDRTAEPAFVVNVLLLVLLAVGIAVLCPFEDI